MNHEQWDEKVREYFQMDSAITWDIAEKIVTKLHGPRPKTLPGKLINFHFLVACDESGVNFNQGTSLVRIPFAEVPSVIDYLDAYYKAVG